MSFKIGDIDVADEILELRFQLSRTQLILEKLIEKNSQLNNIDDNEYKEINDKAITLMQKKYPNLNIKIKKDFTG